ncbi:hypothetical protein BDR22DRAFT_236105 [Usnea florida]
MLQNTNAGPIMVRSDAEVPYINQVLLAHRSTSFAYRYCMGPARRVQLVFPCVPLPSPQSAVIQTLQSRGLRSKASSDSCAAYQRAESVGTQLGSEITEAGDVETGHDANPASSHVLPGEDQYLQKQIQASNEEDRLEDKCVHPVDFDGNINEDTLFEKHDGGVAAPVVTRTHRALCAADFEDSDNEDSSHLDDDVVGHDSEAHAPWSSCERELAMPQGRRLTTVQLQIQEDVLRHIVRQAVKARSDGTLDSKIFSDDAPEYEDWILETVLGAMESGEQMVAVGCIEGEEGHDIQMMLRKYLHILMRESTRPFRPSGANVRADPILSVFRQIRLQLLQENPGISMREILKEKGLSSGLDKLCSSTQD